jgi:hypothetical protein
MTLLSALCLRQRAATDFLATSAKMRRPIRKRQGLGVSVRPRAAAQCPWQIKSKFFHVIPRMLISSLRREIEKQLRDQYNPPCGII